MQSMSGKVALVTGGGSGMGQAASLLFAEYGAKVVIADIDERGGADVARMIEEKGGKALFVRTDVGDEASVKNLIGETVANFGQIDYANNNAGIAAASVITETPIETFDRLLNVNLRGMWFCMKYELLEMQKRGSGSIVNTISTAGLMGYWAQAEYGASKYGAVGLTKCVAGDFAQRGIRINAVCPGTIRTPMSADFIANADPKDLLGATPMRRVGEAREVAEAVVWLASDKASFVTGAILPVDGGQTAIVTGWSPPSSGAWVQNSDH